MTELEKYTSGLTKIEPCDLPDIIANATSGINKYSDSIEHSLTKAKTSSDSASKKSAGWSFWGKDKREAIEALQTAAVDLADSNAEIAKAVTLAFENQAKMSDAIKYLFGLGVSNIAANRMVVKELMFRLTADDNSRAKGHAILSDMARKEMVAIVGQLKAQEDLFNRIEKHKEAIAGVQSDLRALSSQMPISIKDSEETVMSLTEEMIANLESELQALESRSHALLNRSANEIAEKIDAREKSILDNMNSSLVDLSDSMLALIEEIRSSYEEKITNLKSEMLALIEGKEQEVRSSYDEKIDFMRRSHRRDMILSYIATGCVAAMAAAGILLF